MKSTLSLSVEQEYEAGDHQQHARKQTDDGHQPLNKETTLARPCDRIQDGVLGRLGQQKDYQKKNEQQHLLLQS